MTIRTATYADLPALRGLVLDMYEGSVFAEVEGCGVDVKALNALLTTGMQRHGGKHAGATFLMIGERDGTPRAFLLGTVDRIHCISNKLYATDILTYSAPDADKRDIFRLTNAFHRWAESVPDCVMVKCGATNEAGLWEDGERLYKAKGMEQVGVIYATMIERVAREEAA